MRILGIDLGSVSIKAVEIDSAFGRFEIKDYHEVPIKAGAEPKQVLSQFVRGLAKKPDRIIVAMPAGQVTFRNLRLPVKGKKAIQATIGFELEDEIPFPIEQSAYDHTVLGQGRQGSEVHVEATLKRNLTPLIESWKEAEIDPDIITSEGWAYRTLLTRVVAAEPGAMPVLLVQMGNEKTILFGQWQGSPVLAREIPWGGRDLTAAISQKYSIPLDQAEQAKLDHGFVISEGQRGEATPEQVEFSETLLTPLRALSQEIRQAILTCKNATHQNVGVIYLAGGTSLLPGVTRVFEEVLQVPVRPLQALSSIGTSGVTYSEHTDATFTLASSLALTQVGPDRAGQINFRKGEFAKHVRGREFNTAVIKRVALAAGAVLGCLFVSLTVQSSIYKARLTDLDSQLEKSVRGFFGQLSGSAARTYISNPTSLRASVNKELTKQRELSRLLGPNPHSPLDFVRDLSAAIPKDIVMDLTQYQVGAAPASPYSGANDTTANLTVLVTNPQMAEKLAAILGGKLTGMQKGKLEEVPSPDGKKLKITFTGKPTEESYGK